MEWNKEQPILVAGAGISGTNALRLLLREGYKPILYDGNPKWTWRSFTRSWTAAGILKWCWAT